MPDREYRGKRLDNGEWVEGYYVAHAGCCHSIIPAPFGGYIAQDGTFYAPVAYIVDPSTVSRVDQWISVKERLPECGTDVLLCFHESANMVVGGRDEDGSAWYANTDGEFYTECDTPPTHWMPLPPPPGEEAPHD